MILVAYRVQFLSVKNNWRIIHREETFWCASDSWRRDAQTYSFISLRNFLVSHKFRAMPCWWLGIFGRHKCLLQRLFGKNYLREQRIGLQKLQRIVYKLILRILDKYFVHLF